MLTLSGATWNALLLGTLLLGGVFIVLTRAQPATRSEPAAAPQAAAAPAPVAQSPAPDFTLAALDGSPITLSELRG